MKMQELDGSTKTYDEQLHMFFRREASNPLEERRVFTIYPNGRMDNILLSTAIRNKYRIYEHINRGEPTGKIGRMTKADLRKIGAVQFDFEYAPDRTKSWLASDDTYNELLKRSIILPGQAMQRGAGGKIIVPIPFLFARDAEQSLQFEDAWYQVRTQLNREIMEPIERKYDINFKLDKCTLSGLASAHGTFRPYNPKKHDALEFQNGMIRDIVYSDGKIHPSSVLQAMLLEAKEHPIKKTKDHIREQKQPIDIMEEIEISAQRNLIRNYIKSKEGGSDDAFYSCMNMLTKYYGDEEAIKLAEIVNAESGWPYKTKERAVFAAQEIISKFNNYEHLDNQHGTIEKPTRMLKINTDNDSAQLIVLWSEQNLRQNESARIPVRNAYECYSSWVQMKGYNPTSDRHFFRVMKESGFTPEKIMNVRSYRGVELSVRMLSIVA